ncbi:Outer envelope pore protein 21B, chloroplastic [Apostasia shenzhenica]|uniref:Outer envelope pore protein 21B, chloroplastic n=1 Tax=Apostasia shenzhenica TaxID=1088818 RepID=A0A2H9ZZK9_9ASPA|nr:Outer envelope pore protein 21B, chloroplastic [Apostasia shenzhenica]
MSIRRFFPEISASMGTGLQYNQDKFAYNVRAKKAFSISSNGMLGFNFKCRCDVDKDFNQRKVEGVVEFVWSLLNFQKDQDVRIKAGYDFHQNLPYLQIRENNWTMNADSRGKWNVRFDL